MLNLSQESMAQVLQECEESRTNREKLHALMGRVKVFESWVSVRLGRRESACVMILARLSH